MVQEIDRIRIWNRIVDSFVSLNEYDQHFQTVRILGAGSSVPEMFYFLKRGLIVALGFQGSKFHVLSSDRACVNSVVFAMGANKSHIHHAAVVVNRANIIANRILDQWKPTDG